ncbi:MAG: hypothetical protein ACLFVU_10210 [Phycisphaerae bacterium]
MARKKNSVAPFEVVQQARQEQQNLKMKVPAWMNKEEETGAAEQTQQPGQQGPPPLAEAPRKPRPAAPRMADERMVEILPGRLKLALSPVILGIIAAVLILLLVGSFLLGRSMVATTAEPVVKKPAAPTTWTKGNYYLVIQEMAGNSAADRAAAEDIVQFLQNAGEEFREGGIHAGLATIPRDGEKVLIVWSKDPFKEVQDNPDAREYVQDVKQAGQEYRRRGGRYGFQNPRFVKY